MLSKRIIACLDVRDGKVVKGINFEGLRTAGDPAELARRYNAEGVDELVILDITATLERRRALADTIRAVARELFIPLAVGGGIRTEEDAAAAVDPAGETGPAQPGVPASPVPDGPAPQPDASVASQGAGTGAHRRRSANLERSEWCRR